MPLQEKHITVNTTFPSLWKLRGHIAGGFILFLSCAVPGAAAVPVSVCSQSLSNGAMNDGAFSSDPVWLLLQAIWKNVFFGGTVYCYDIDYASSGTGMPSSGHISFSDVKLNLRKRKYLYV